MSRAERRRQERRSASTTGGRGAVARGGPPGWLSAVVIVTAGIAAYATSFDGVFVLDDIGHIVDTTRIDDLAASFTGRRPVVNFTLGMNYALGGLETGGYHVVNLVIHLLAALTLFGVVRRSLLGIERLASTAPWLALSAALLWVVHPLQTQSVTYVIQRSESLMGLFYLLTLYAFIRGTATPRGWPWFVASIAACGLGMGCKEVMVTAPFMVLLYDVVFVAGSIGRALRRRWAVHAGLVATWGVLILCGIGSVFDADSGGQVGFGFEGVTVEYARTQPEIILHYLRLTVWPRHLCLDYMWPVQPSWGAFAAAASGLVVLGLATVVLLVRRQPLGYLGAWFFVVLAPTSSVVPVRDLAFEHRMYLPLAAIVLAAVLVIDATARFAARRRGVSDTAGRAAAAIVVLLVTVAFAVRTAQRNGDYSSALRTWQEVVELRPQNDRAQQNLGSALLTAGRIDEAAEHSRIAVGLNPENANAHINLGTVSMQRGAFDEAIGHLETAIRVAPDNPVACNNLGSLYARRGDMARAYDYFAEAVRLEPGYVKARFSLGRVLEGRGDTAGALREYRAVIEIDPSHEGAQARVVALSQ